MNIYAMFLSIAGRQSLPPGLWWSFIALIVVSTVILIATPIYRYPRIVGITERLRRANQRDEVVP